MKDTIFQRVSHIAWWRYKIYNVLFPLRVGICHTGCIPTQAANQLQELLNGNHVTRIHWKRWFVIVWTQNSDQGILADKPRICYSCLFGLSNFPVVAVTTSLCFHNKQVIDVAVNTRSFLLLYSLSILYFKLS